MAMQVIAQMSVKQVPLLFDGNASYCSNVCQTKMAMQVNCLLGICHIIILKYDRNVTYCFSVRSITLQFDGNASYCFSVRSVILHFLWQCKLMLSHLSGQLPCNSMEMQVTTWACVRSVTLHFCDNAKYCLGICQTNNLEAL